MKEIEIEISKINLEIDALLKEGKRKEAVSLFQKNKKLFEDGLKEKQDKKEFISTTGHSYSGWNLYFLAHLSKPGVFGTFKQWKAIGRTVPEKGTGIPIQVPFIGKKKKKSDDKKSDGEKIEKEIKYFSVKYIWHEDDTVPMK